MKHVLIGLLAGAAASALPALALAQPQSSPIMRQTPPPPPSPTPPADATAVLDRITRAQANLEALRLGRLSVSDLSPQDLQDVLDFDRRVRGEVADTRTPSQQCVDDEVRRAGGNPSRLAWRVIELKCR